MNYIYYEFRSSLSFGEVTDIQTEIQAESNV